MQLNNLTIEFIEKLTMREYHQINKLYTNLQNKVIDEIELGIALASVVIATINGERDKQTITELLWDMEDIDQMALLNEEISKKINYFQEQAKKKKS